MSLIKNTLNLLGKAEETREVSNTNDKKSTGLGAAITLTQEGTNRLWEVFVEALKTPANKVVPA